METKEQLVRGLPSVEDHCSAVVEMLVALLLLTMVVEESDGSARSSILRWTPSSSSSLVLVLFSLPEEQLDVPGSIVFLSKKDNQDIVETQWPPSG